jgi:RNA polymerase sigma-70 factor (ECF subfamily)
MLSSSPDTDELLDLVQKGESGARHQLLQRHQSRLRKMVSVHLDRRIAARVDPSDVVQETLAAADRQLTAYLRDRPLPFYPWLRGIARERLVKLHRRHLSAKKRSAHREEPGVLDLPEESVLELASKLVASGSAPSKHLLREELRERVQQALAQLRETDREVLVLRYLEQLSTRETAAVLGISEGAVKVRHLRALERLRQHLGDDLGENES